MTMDELLSWNDGELAPDRAGKAPLLVADSWLVQDGRARGLDRHQDRFTRACAGAAGLAESEVAPFWRAALDRLPRHGDLFPRVELTETRRPALRLRVRPAPERHRTIRAWRPGQPDPRRLPRRKGPDLDELDRLRAQARDAGADDALLLSPSGLVLESGTASLLWWDQDRLCVPDPALPTLEGVTATMIRAAAARRGIEVVPRRCPLDALAGHEAWLVNALHGIRPVTAWVGTAVRPGPAYRAPGWQRWWEDLAAPRPVPVLTDRSGTG
jgi:branched-subunit amino acid aminotransferase/4-amino-4-deoxychorismate lyase